MVTRRRFVGMLAALPAMTALAGVGLRLSQRETMLNQLTDSASFVNYANYLTPRGAWEIIDPPPPNFDPERPWLG